MFKNTLLIATILAAVFVGQTLTAKMPNLPASYMGLNPASAAHALKKMVSRFAAAHGSLTNRRYLRRLENGEADIKPLEDALVNMKEGIDVFNRDFPNLFAVGELEKSRQHLEDNYADFYKIAQGLLEETINSLGGGLLEMDFAKTAILVMTKDITSGIQGVKEQWAIWQEKDSQLSDASRKKLFKMGVENLIKTIEKGMKTAGDVAQRLDALGKKFDGARLAFGNLNNRFIIAKESDSPPQADFFQAILKQIPGALKKCGQQCAAMFLPLVSLVCIQCVGQEGKAAIDEENKRVQHLIDENERLLARTEESLTNFAKAAGASQARCTAQAVSSADFKTEMQRLLPNLSQESKFGEYISPNDWRQKIIALMDPLNEACLVLEKKFDAQE